MKPGEPISYKEQIARWMSEITLFLIEAKKVSLLKNLQNSSWDLPRLHSKGYRHSFFGDKATGA
jgi:hypothetical protein